MDCSEKSSQNDLSCEGEFSRKWWVMLTWDGGVLIKDPFAGWNNMLNTITLAQPRLLRLTS